MLNIDNIVVMSAVEWPDIETPIPRGVERALPVLGPGYQRREPAADFGRAVGRHDFPGQSFDHVGGQRASLRHLIQERIVIKPLHLDHRVDQRAAAIKPGTTETATALTEVATEETAHTLRALAARGQQAEAEERWADAVTHYKKALALDASVLFASDGLARAEPRARLAQQLELLLAEPERMADIKVADATAKLLDDARSFGPPDTLLRDQVDRLSELLRKANTPVTVTLRSDAATNVVVHKVARLGTFESHSLALRPGTYTAVGSRRGYRDVRHSFTIEPGASSTAITIRCTEPI